MIGKMKRKGWKTEEEEEGSSYEKKVSADKRRFLSRSEEGE